MANILALYKLANSLKLLKLHKNYDPDKNLYTFDYNSWKNIHNPEGDPNINKRIDLDWLATNRARAKYWDAVYRPGVIYTVPEHALGLPELDVALPYADTLFKYLPTDGRSFASSSDWNGKLKASKPIVMHLLGHNLTSTSKEHRRDTGGWPLNPYFLSGDDATADTVYRHPDLPDYVPDNRPYLLKIRIRRENAFFPPYYPTLSKYPSVLKTLPDKLSLIFKQQPETAFYTKGADPENYFNGVPLFRTAMRNIKAQLARSGHSLWGSPGKNFVLKFKQAMLSSGFWKIGDLWKNIDLKKPGSWADVVRFTRNPLLLENTREVKSIPTEIKARLGYLIEAITQHFNRYYFLLKKPNKTARLLNLLKNYEKMLPVLIETSKVKPGFNTKQNERYKYG